MTDLKAHAPVTDEIPHLLTRLAEHKTVGSAPREELEWLARHGTLAHLHPGDMIARKGEPVEALFIILEGRVWHLTDQGGTWRKVMSWSAGEVTGMLPYSRLAKAPGNSVVQEPTEILHIDRAHLPEMPSACPNVTAALVHVMVDRVRMFKSSDLQVEKMTSLGKLAAGLAHELNNPASAAARSAQLVTQALVEVEDSARALGAAGLDASQTSLIDRLRSLCLSSPSTSVLSPLERADREESIVNWLLDHDADDALAAPLAETEIAVEQLDALAAVISGDQLRASLRWMAAGCTVRSLARDIERAASRVHTLVSAVKGFTYMDQASAPEPVDIAKGLTDTLAVLGAKARGKSVAITVDAPRDLPRVKGFGGELNQVWANLLDNAIDAVGTGGRVSVTARVEGDRVAVRVIDDGPGISKELLSRIFDPFFTTKPVGTGTGLGLDIVRRLVDQNSGIVDVDSVPGRTEFRVVLPMAP
jgi:signal transduction histidine kinase